MKKLLKLSISTLLLGSLCLTGCGKSMDDVRTVNVQSMSPEDAKTELSALKKKINVTSVENPLIDLSMDDSVESVALADIDTFPLSVIGEGDVDIEIAAATELSSDAPDDWLNIVADQFNREKIQIDGKTVSVSIRKIASGEVVTYITNNRYNPDAFIPSNDAWGKMLDSEGYKVDEITDRLVGNTAGILMKKDTYDTFISKYNEVTVQNVLTAANNKDLLFAYTNPYTSSTGLNVLTAMLASFDKDDPLSATAVSALTDYQKTSPPVAYTTSILRNQAAKGIINAMVMEEQAYINTPELKSYVYTPVGIRHDHPVYAFDWTGDIEKEILEKFVDYCCTKEMQNIATKRGFNLHDDYVSQDTGMSGSDYIAAQKIWKENKNGGKPVVAVFIADVSGSMDGTPINSLKDSLIKSSVYIGDSNYVGLVSYSSDVTINLPIAQFDATQRAKFAGEVKNLYASGGTATYDALLVGMDMIEQTLAEVPNAKPIIFLLTDGDQNQGYSLKRVTGIVGGLQIPVYSIAYNYGVTDDLKTLSSINEAAALNADTDDIVNQLRNLFNVNM